MNCSWKCLYNWVSCHWLITSFAALSSDIFLYPTLFCFFTFHSGFSVPQQPLSALTNSELLCFLKRAFKHVHSFLSFPHFSFWFLRTSSLDWHCTLALTLLFAHSASRIAFHWFLLLRFLLCPPPLRTFNKARIRTAGVFFSNISY